MNFYIWHVTFDIWNIASDVRLITDGQNYYFYQVSPSFMYPTSKPHRSYQQELGNKPVMQSWVLSHFLVWFTRTHGTSRVTLFPWVHRLSTECGCFVGVVLHQSVDEIAGHGVVTVGLKTWLPDPCEVGLQWRSAFMELSTCAPHFLCLRIFPVYQPVDPPVGNILLDVYLDRLMSFYLCYGTCVGLYIFGFCLWCE